MSSKLAETLNKVKERVPSDQTQAAASRPSGNYQLLRSIAEKTPTQATASRPEPSERSVLARSLNKAKDRRDPGAQPTFQPPETNFKLLRNITNKPENKTSEPESSKLTQALKKAQERGDSGGSRPVYTPPPSGNFSLLKNLTGKTEAPVADDSPPMSRKPTPVAAKSRNVVPVEDSRPIRPVAQRHTPAAVGDEEDDDVDIEEEPTPPPPSKVPSSAKPPSSVSSHKINVVNDSKNSKTTDRPIRPRPAPTEEEEEELDPIDEPTPPPVPKKTQAAKTASRDDGIKPKASTMNQGGDRPIKPLPKDVTVGDEEEDIEDPPVIPPPRPTKPVGNAKSLINAKKAPVSNPWAEDSRPIKPAAQAPAAEDEDDLEPLEAPPEATRSKPSKMALDNQGKRLQAKGVPKPLVVEDEAEEEIQDVEAEDDTHEREEEEEEPPIPPPTKNRRPPSGKTVAPKPPDALTQAVCNTILATDDPAVAKKALEDLSRKLKGKNFIDSDFGPNEIDPKGVRSIFRNGQPLTEHDGLLPIENITWLRPKDFCPGDPCFMGAQSQYELDDEENIQEETDPSIQPSAQRPAKGPAPMPKRYLRGLDGETIAASSRDIVQSKVLGDLWFLNALALVTMDQPLLIKMLCENFASYREKGLYCFRFYKDGVRIYVIVDDLVPCYPTPSGGKPIFAHCRDKNEFWVCLLEKAYAKLHGSYFSLSAGRIHEALQDMTHLSPLRIETDAAAVEKAPSRNKKQMELDRLNRLWTQISALQSRGCFLGCLRESERKSAETEFIPAGYKRGEGILQKHVYCIIDLREMTDPTDQSVHKLVRLKNPWGNLEWKGAWCDGDKVRWTAGMKEAYREAPTAGSRRGRSKAGDVSWEEDDGVFVMNFDDFLVYFNTVLAGRKLPPSWSGMRFLGDWTYDSTPGPPHQHQANWSAYPQFTFQIKEETQLLVVLQQPDARFNRSLDPPFSAYRKHIGFMVFSLANKEKRFETFTDSKFRFNSEMTDSISADREGTLPVGRYSIVCATNEKMVCSSFTLSIYFNSAKHNIVFEQPGEIIKEEEEPELVDDRPVGGKSTRNLDQEVDDTEPDFDAIEQPPPAKPAAKPATGAIPDKSATVRTGPATPLKKTAAQPVASKTTVAAVENRPAPFQVKTARHFDLVEDTKSILGGVDALRWSEFASKATLLGIDLTETSNQPSDSKRSVVEKLQLNSTIDVAHYRLGDRGLISLLSVITQMDKIEHISLVNNQLTSVSIVHLLAALEKAKHFDVQTLNLKQNRIDSLGGEALIAFADKCPHLSSIDLFGNPDIDFTLRQRLAYQERKNQGRVFAKQSAKTAEQEPQPITRSLPPKPPVGVSKAARQVGGSEPRSTFRNQGLSGVIATVANNTAEDTKSLGKGPDKRKALNTSKISSYDDDEVA